MTHSPITSAMPSLMPGPTPRATPGALPGATPKSTTGAGPAAGGKADYNARLRQRVDEFLGVFFYGTMLRQSRQSRLTDAKFGFGGRGEQAFAAQLDIELAQRVGQASHNSLGEVIYRQLKKA